MTRILCLAAAALLSLPATSAAAQTLTPDQKELATYTLTMDTVRKMMSATKLMAAEEANDPKNQERAKIERRIEALESKDELTEAESAELEKLRERLETFEAADDDSKDPNTLAELEARIKSHPAAARALAAAGITPREYARAMMALMQAAVVEGFSQGKADLNKLPPGINPANVQFVREHRAELEALQNAVKQKK